MRTIKFRGKNNSGKWVYGAYAAFKGLLGAIYFPKRHRSDGRVLYIDWCYVDERTVGQFTGLTDKNGKEIYEGDIMKCSIIGKPRIGIVMFHAGSFYLFECSGFSDEWIYNCTGKEVIGNIHDNPELLKDYINNTKELRRKKNILIN